MLDDGIVYIVRSFGTATAARKQINAIMDYDGNIICWKNEQDAYQYILNHGLETNFKVVQRQVKDLKKLVQEFNAKNKPVLGIKIISTVEF
ncbi:MAG: hypothetical protein L0Y80_07640 [Ignavibacteriae bacterium]|nr:hypothetical protein [Ignavibacteriota bacterium]